MSENNGPHIDVFPEAGHVVIRARDGGYSVETNRDHPVIEYDRTRYKLERDSTSTEQMERFRIVPKL